MKKKLLDWLLSGEIFVAEQLVSNENVIIA